MEHDYLKNIKLVVLDLDGTLLNEEGEIGEETISLTKKLREKDVHFTFASGRLHSALTDYAEILSIDLPIISLDGALIKNHQTGEIISTSYVPEKYVHKAIRLADEKLVKIALCHADAIYFTEYNVTIPEILDKFGAKYEEIHSYDGLYDKTLEIVCASDYGDAIKFINNKLTFPYSFGLNTSYFKSHSRKGIYYLEVRKGNTSKGEGLNKLLKKMKIKFSETVVVGDWYNDRSLFETKAHKAAMGNAVPEIQNLATIQLKRTNNEDGVAELLQMILKAKS